MEPTKTNRNRPNEHDSHGPEKPDHDRNNTDTSRSVTSAEDRSGPGSAELGKTSPEAEIFSATRGHLRNNMIKDKKNSVPTEDISSTPIEDSTASATTVAEGQESSETMTITNINNNEEALPPTTVPADIDELAQFTLPSGQECATQTQKLLTQIPVRKPTKQEFVRTEPDLTQWKPRPLLELKDSGEIYLVTGEVFQHLEGEPTLISARLVPSVTSAGVFFFWPIRIPDADGRMNSWHESAANAAALARSQWIRLTANRGLGGYDVMAGKFQQEPRWPELAQAELIKIAFRGRMITTLDHPVIRRLQGLAA